MLSKEDFKHKQIVFIIANQCHFRLDADNLYKESLDGNKKYNLHTILAIFIIGSCTISTPFISKCQKLGISIIFTTRSFKFLFDIKPTSYGNYLLRQRQYNFFEIEEMEYAKKIVKNKITNQIALLKAKNYDYEKINLYLDSVESCNTSYELMGIEGIIAKEFFQEYYKTIGWRRRAPRTKEDIPNLLMDIGYTMVFNLVDSILMLFGFDTYKGIYHKLFFQRKSLSCDIMEPLRCIVDKQILKMYNLGQVKEKDFGLNRNAEYYLDWDNGKKYIGIIAGAIMVNKEEIFVYVKGYYQHFMNPQKNDYKPFLIK
jgi:CRISP-associated protein Cas1